MNRISDRYDANDRDVDPQTGLLRNKLGITSQDELERIEEQCLVFAY